MDILRFFFLLCLAGSLLAAADNSGFRKHVKPFLGKHCNTCHNAKAKVANLDLARFESADAVLADQEIWDRVLRKVRDGEMPPKGLPRPSEVEVKAMAGWLRAEYAKYDKSGKHDPGRVTARRLNRTEYNNTIRDLIGMDLRPADAFPVDDSGYGFDNIGDVLSISPALMEKYITAAERISREALQLPRTYKEMSDRFRSDRIKHNGPPGSIVVKHLFPAEGDYDIRIALAGRRTTETEAMQVILEVDGKEEKRFPAFFEVNRQRVLDWKIRPKGGLHVVKAYLADAAGEAYSEDKGLLVEYLDLRGPKNAAPFAQPPSHKLILVCGEYPGKYDDACLRRIVENFARRAFRRPVTAQEVDGFLRYAKGAKDEGEVPEIALRFALQAILISPQFLFRVERDAKPVDAGAKHEIGQFELAARLSYFLWNSMPDETLFELAEKRQLRKPGVMESQVARMLADVKFGSFVENFTGQWLLLRNLDEVKPAPEKFPMFDGELREAMKKETQLFFESVVNEDRSIVDFLDARYTFLNERLARHYGISGVKGREFRRVELDTPQRGGLLTMGSLLTVSSYPTRTSPVLRGKFLLENFLNAPPPPAPPNVPSLEESSKGMTGSLRVQMEKHRSNAMCASCHVKMDPLGFGLENYDAIGRWREKDGEFPVDSSGMLPGGKTFQSPAEFKKLLTGNRDDFAECLTEKMLTYALGRGLEKNDRTYVRQIVRDLGAERYRFSRLVLDIVKSTPFQMRRGEATAGKTAD